MGEINMNLNCYAPSFIKCGCVYEPNLPPRLDPSEPPILLADLKLNSEEIANSCILIKFSEFINFTLLGLNPTLEITYQLIRKEQGQAYDTILQEWDFGFDTIRLLEASNVETNQPTVLNYCDDLEHVRSCYLTYELVITQIKTEALLSYGITNKSFVATLISEEADCCRCELPYVKCGDVFNYVLPLTLSTLDEPVKLTQVTIYPEAYEDTVVLINFSSFVSSVLKGDEINHLTFRLIKKVGSGRNKVLQEWQFRRVFVSETTILEPVVYNYCDCLTSDCEQPCTYMMQLVEANLSSDSFYNITNKSMIAQVYNQNEDHFECLCLATWPYVKCVKVPDKSFHELVPAQKPIDIASLTVETKTIKKPHILLNYSQNFEFKYSGEDPDLTIVYRLIRRNQEDKCTEVLEHWTYRVAEVIPTTVPDLITIEPLILNYCDESIITCRTYKYTIQIVKVTANNTSFNLTNQELSAIVTY